MNATTEQIVALWNAGERDTAVIAAEVNRTTRTVCRTLVNANCRPLRVLERTYSREITPEVVAMLEDGASYTDVGETFGIHAKWLSSVLPGYGWDGDTCGTMAHALKDANVRKIFHEIRRIPLDEAERIIAGTIVPERKVHYVHNPLRRN